MHSPEFLQKAVPNVISAANHALSNQKMQYDIFDGFTPLIHAPLEISTGTMGGALLRCRAFSPNVMAAYRRIYCTSPFGAALYDRASVEISALPKPLSTFSS